MSELYKKSGVDVDAGERSASQIGKLASKVKRPEIISGIGGFAGLFQPNIAKYKEPVLVSATDGVGTKLKIAQALGKHNTVGIDLVAMCVNDVLTIGAESLFFLDYISIGKLNEEKVASIVAGIVDGCAQSGCCLLGGETAEHPNVMEEDDYDLAGFVVGIIDKDKIIDGSGITAGDKLIGLVSSGLHSNGFSLVRKILSDNPKVNLNTKIGQSEKTLGEQLLSSTIIYAETVKKLIEKYSVKGMAHITGGGITKNLPRIIPDGLSAEIEINSWSPPHIFKFLADACDGGVDDMYSTFNMGIGYIIVVGDEISVEVLDFLRGQGEEAYELGVVTKGESGVQYIT